jgi:hypothetical protein
LDDATLSTVGQASGLPGDDVGQVSRVPISDFSDDSPGQAGRLPHKSKRRQTSHLKLVPQDKALREALQARAGDVTAKLDKSRPLTKDEMEVVARRTLEDAGQP